MKKLLCILLSAAVLFSLAACSAAPPVAPPPASPSQPEPAAPVAPPAESKPAEEAPTTVLMGINSAQPPASFVKEDGTVGGQNYAVMTLVDELLPQYEFVYEAVDQDALLLGLDSGKYAAAVGNFWYNEKRNEKYLFPKYPIGGGVEGLAVNKKFFDKVDSLDDFAEEGLKLTPQETSGAMYDVFMQYNADNPDHPLKFTAGEVTASGEQMKWVKEGRYDGAAMFASEFDELKPTVDADDKLYFVPFYAVKTWVLYTKDQTELVAAIDGVMAKLKDDGTLSKIAVEWFGYDIYEYFD